MAYLSRSPNPSLDTYDGSGDWFKIAYFGPKNDTYWLTRDQPGMNFSIPLTTPPGKYLLRIEHMYVRSAFNTTQFYIECAQIDVVGPGGGRPEPLVKFPGAYDLRDRGECASAVRRESEEKKEGSVNLKADWIECRDLGI
jgi:hypothetical protein